MKSRTLIRWLASGGFLATVLAGCAFGPRISAPVSTREAAAPVAAGDVQVYQAAQDIERAGSDKAPDAYLTFVDKFPSSPLAPQALLRLGNLYQQRGQLGAARDAYRRLTADYGQDRLAAQAAVEILATLYKEGDFENLISGSRTIDRGLLDNAQRQRVGQMRTDAFLALGRNAEAAEAALDTWQSAPEAQRPGLVEKLALALGALSPQAVAELLARPMEPEAKRLVDDLAMDMAFDRRTLGCLLPLSGSYAVYGQRALRGIEMALGYFATRPAAQAVRLVVEDTQSRSDQAAAGVQALAARRVAAILGPMVTAATAAAVAQRLRIPIVIFTQREEIPAIGDYVFRHFITPFTQAEALVRWAVTHQGIKRFAVLHPADRYGQTFLASFTDAVAAQGGRMVGIAAYDPAGTDFAGPILSLVRQNSGPGGGFEALFLPDEPNKAGLVIPHLAFHDVVGIRLMGTNLWQSQTLIDMADKFVEGAVFPTGFFEDDPDPAVAEFRAAFRTAYGHDPGFIEAVAYDTAMMLFGILDQSRIRRHSAVRDALAAGTHHTGLTGETYFDSGGENHKALNMLMIQDGRFILLDAPPLNSESARTTDPAP